MELYCQYCLRPLGSFGQKVIFTYIPICHYYVEALDLIIEADCPVRIVTRSIAWFIKREVNHEIGTNLQRDLSIINSNCSLDFNTRDERQMSLDPNNVYYQASHLN